MGFRSGDAVTYPDVQLSMQTTVNGKVRGPSSYRYEQARVQGRAGTEGCLNPITPGTRGAWPQRDITNLEKLTPQCPPTPTRFACSQASLRLKQPNSLKFSPTRTTNSNIRHSIFIHEMADAPQTISHVPSSIHDDVEGLPSVPGKKRSPLSVFFRPIYLACRYPFLSAILIYAGVAFSILGAAYWSYRRDMENMASLIPPSGDGVSFFAATRSSSV